MNQPDSVLETSYGNKRNTIKALLERFIVDAAITILNDIAARDQLVADVNQAKPCESINCPFKDPIQF